MSTLTGTWLKAEFFPHDAVSIVGGAIGLDPFTGLLSEAFEVGKSKALGRGSYERYRKIFFRNDGNDVDDAVAFFQTVQHLDQIRFAFEKVASDTSVDSATMPAGYTTGDFVSPVGLIDAEPFPVAKNPLVTAGTIGFWLMQRIPEGLSPETGAVATLRIAGDVAP